MPPKESQFGTQLAVISEQIKNIQKDIGQIKDDNRLNASSFVTKENFETYKEEMKLYKNFVIGVMIIIGGAVLTALLSLILPKVTL